MKIENYFTESIVLMLKCFCILAPQPRKASDYGASNVKMLSLKSQKIILALGAESAGVFACLARDQIMLSENFGDLLVEKNFIAYQKAILNYFKKEGLAPDIILTDLHPLYKTTIWGGQLAKKYKIPHLKIQHHLAHIFSAVGDSLILNLKSKILKLKSGNLPREFVGLAMDGTGYGFDGKIWGGEIFQFKVQSSKLKVIERIGHLENQIMIGNDLAVREPARMLISILSKVKNQKSKINTINNQKNFIYCFAKKYYSRNEFELLYNQLQQNFNCLQTSSAARILDATAILLGLAGNRREFKHQATQLLAENSTEPYYLKPVIEIEKSLNNFQFSIFNFQSNAKSQILNSKQLNIFKNKQQRYVLQTTPLFEFLIKNINKDKKRLAATVQYYLARGFYEIIKKSFKFQVSSFKSYFAGGLADNKIISAYLKSRGVYASRQIPRGDPGLAFGQIVYYLLQKC